MRGALQFAELIEDDGARLRQQRDKLRDDWLPRKIPADCEDSWEEPNFFVLAVPAVQRCS